MRINVRGNAKFLGSIIEIVLHCLTIRIGLGLPDICRRSHSSVIHLPRPS